MDRPRHFSMIREFHLADFLTLGNAACGVGGVLLAMMYVGSQSPIHFFLAAALAPCAFTFDVFDGKVARSRQEHSALGRELDSLADVISFGMAPAGTCTCKSCFARTSGLMPSDSACCRTWLSAARADSCITLPSCPVRINPRSPGIAVASIVSTSPPDGVHASPSAAPG